MARQGTRWALALVVASLLIGTVGQAVAQPGFGRGFGGRGRGGPPGDPQFAVDRDVFQHLLGQHDQVQRHVTKRADGVETLTESNDPQVASKIQEHVSAMYRRLETGRPIHARDPLFAELFRHADKIELKYEKTDRGAKVIETSTDPYVVQLIQAHADVVNQFVKSGFPEAHKDHAVPSREAAEDSAASDACPGCPTAQAAAAVSAATCEKACVGCPKSRAVAASGADCQGAGGCPVFGGQARAAGCPGNEQAAASCPLCPRSADKAPTGGCPFAGAAAGCQGCPQATVSESCPKAPGCQGCPKSGDCQSCPKAAAASQECPSAAASDPKCEGCPSKAAADSPCKTCPKAGACPAGQSCPSDSGDEAAPPLPTTAARN